MNPRPDFCPGCGAQVYPEEAHCPFCGRNLRSSPWLSFLMGLGGAAAALLVGALVWWVLDALPAGEGAPASPQQVTAQAQAPASSQAGAQVSASAAPANGATASAGLAAPAASSAGAPAPAPTAAAVPASQSAPGAQDAAPSTKDAERFVSTGTAVASADPQAAVSDEPLPLPKVQAAPPEVAADADARKAFAQDTQERLTNNGLDLTVATSGEAESVLTIKFNFPAKTAAELIVAGPFPHQCAERGFKQVVFADPSGISWLYDVATQKMTQR